MPQVTGRRLARMREREQRMLPDTCIILRYDNGVHVADDESTPCRFQDATTRTGNISFTPAGTPADAVQLPMDSAFTFQDRIRLTHRDGNELDEPEEYIPVTSPRYTDLLLVVEVRVKQ